MSFFIPIVPSFYKHLHSLSGQVKVSTLDKNNHPSQKTPETIRDRPEFKTKESLRNYLECLRKFQKGKFNGICKVENKPTPHKEVPKHSTMHTTSRDSNHKAKLPLEIIWQEILEIIR